MIHGPNIPGSHATLFFTTLDSTFTTRHIHNWASLLLWPSHFILFGAISNCPPLFPSSIMDTFQPGGSLSSVTFFCLFILFMVFSWQEYWSGLPFSPPVDYILPELFTVTYPSWVALHGMAHSFIELYKSLCHNKAMIHKGKWNYYSAIKRNAFESILMRWMNLEPITQSEVNQKNKHHILMHTHGI